MNASLVIMGVAGCGKSSLGARLALATGGRLIEGDDYHGAANREKMRQGIALTDADREGWLETLGGLLRSHPRGSVLTCSALKKAYRDKLRSAQPGLTFLHLKIGRGDSQRRVAARAGDHFFSASLVDSQFAALEPPDGEPGVLVLDAMQPLPELTARAMEWLDERERA